MQMENLKINSTLLFKNGCKKLLLKSDKPKIFTQTFVNPIPNRGQGERVSKVVN